MGISFSLYSSRSSKMDLDITFHFAVLLLCGHRKWTRSPGNQFLFRSSKWTWLMGNPFSLPSSRSSSRSSNWPSLTSSFIPTYFFISHLSGFYLDYMVQIQNDVREPREIEMIFFTTSEKKIHNPICRFFVSQW